MFENVTVPQKGDRITAAWGASVANGINALAPMATAFGLARQGANGNGTEPMPENRRVRSAANALPWTFSCTIDPDTEERTGGWTNCILQLGYNYWLISPDVMPQIQRTGTGVITGTDETADGAYVVEVDLKNNTAVIMLSSEATHIYPVDPASNIVYVDIGTVRDGKQVTRIPNHPVIYKYA